MIDIFNTEFELSLRILLILNSVNVQPISIERIVIIDYLTIYGKDFNISQRNLHGDNEYRISELAAKRSLISIAIKTLVVNKLIKASYKSNGFSYSITKQGQEFCLSLNNKYASEYSYIIRNSLTYANKKSDNDLLNEINNFYLLKIRGGQNNE